MKKNIFLSAFLALSFFVSGIAAAQSNYIYRQRVSWVKITKASPKKVPLGQLKHPFSISEEKMEAMLLSIKLSKKYLIKKELNSVDVFNAWEAQKFAPYLVEALQKVDGDHVVNFSVIHKRPIFLLRKDSLSIADVWAAEDGVHFQFSKLFARIDGDYEASANMDKAVRKAKTMRVVLATQEGQKLAYDSPMEIILDPNFNFISNVAVNTAVEVREKPKKEKKVQAKTVEEPTDVGERLRKLDELKRKKLISESEYQKLREKILQEI
ncbi:MAG: SHOCT domain-containing protein [Deltaproteobacteria bacterium]|nr:SHOCT domain-containing protein [Deltaproteobacteria bacterium]